MNRRSSDKGFSLIEVMVAMVISGIALMGTMSALEISSRHVQQSGLGGRALEMAQGRLEVKRSVRWQSLLEDDLNYDGVPETIMKDDGQEPDKMAGDGIYTAMQKRDGVTVVWSVEADRPGPLGAVAMVTIRAAASYAGTGGRKEVHVATIRANPAFSGSR
ncbi:MAG TPA: prepilin-type N-terminal cleavage/methylation domain-containing protein [Nitrospiraceae bacterium]|nr:prepilin-type N-terminal cleavage/methylation domain-containing protein [Nitrospiraceae bacterium]